MAKSFSFFLARRYLKPRGAFVWVINAISVLGVVLGVAILIIVLAVMKGFELMLKDTLLGFQPHIAVAGRGEDEAPKTPYQQVEKALAEHPDVVETSPIVMGPAVMVVEKEGSARRIDAPIIRGLRENDPQLRRLTIPQEKGLGAQGLLVEGQADLSGFVRVNPDGSPQRVDRVIISRSLGKRFQLKTGDEVRLYSVRYHKRFERAWKDARERNPELRLRDVEEEITRSFARRCQIAGVMTTPLNQDQILVPLEMAQDFYELRGGARGDTVHALGAFVKEPYAVDAVKASLARTLPRDWLPVRSWIDASEDQFELIQAQRRMVMVLLFCVILVAGFCVINTIIVTTVSKRREIGIMKAIGAGQAQMTRVFVFQGVIVGMIGTALGVALGLAILPCLNPFRKWLADLGHDPFPEELYKMSVIPTRIQAVDVVGIALAAVFMCALAALAPAWVAARQDAAKALRAT